MSTTLKDDIRNKFEQVRASAKVANQLEAFRAIYEKSGRVMSGHPIRVAMALDSSVTGRNGIPGWTDGETISLNAEVIKNDLGHLPMNMRVLHTKSVFLHELGHVMYSPRQRDDVFKWCARQVMTTSDRRWWYAFNALEDQKMEMMFAAKYRPTSQYFEVIALKWLVNNPANLDAAYILVAGRKFLPAAMVAATRLAFVTKYSEDLANRFVKCIDEYLKVIYPSDTLKAQKCVQQYYDMCLEMEALHPSMGGVPTTTLITDDNGGVKGPKDSDDVTIIRRNAAKVSDQKKAQAKVDDVLPREPKEQAEVDGSDIEDSDDDDGEDGGEGEGDSEAGSSTDGREDQQDGEEAGSSGASDSGAGETESALDAAYEALDELFSDEQFMKELDDTAQAVHEATGIEGLANGSDAGSKEQPVSPQAMQAARRMSTVLTRMRTELEETRNRRQTTGRIDPRRFMTRQPWETDFFSVWEPGQDDQTDLEAVILVDLSGSMMFCMEAVSESLWTVKRALESLDSRVTVLGFSDETYVLYQPNEKVGTSTMKKFNSHNATLPDNALKEAHRLLVTSQRSQKLLVTITDGYWGGNEKQQISLVKGMEAREAVTCMIGIGSAPQGEEGRHGHMIHHYLENIAEMPKIALKIVAESLKLLGVG